MFELDLSKINEEPKLYICKPNLNFSTIGILNDAFNIKIDYKLSQINELNFSIFTDIEINHELVRNPNYELLKYRYLIRYEYNNYKEYFITNVPEDVSDDSGYVKNITCYSLAYSLNDEIINSYKSNNSINATQALNDILLDTAWSVGNIDASFDIMYRQFDISGKTALDAVYDIANTFSAVVIFDSINYKIHLHKTEDGLDEGLIFDYGKYIKDISSKINPDDFATQLYVYGKNNLTISTANVNGSPHLQNYMFYVFPFERDENRNVLKRSDYMSDELCHAILDYNILLESKEGEYNTLYNNKINYIDIVNTKTTELTDIKTSMLVILDSLYLAQANNLPTSELILQRDNKQIEIDNKIKEIKSVLFSINITNGCVASGNINITIDDKSMDIPLTANDNINNVALKINNYINSKYYNVDNNFPLNPLIKCSVVNGVINVIYFTTKNNLDVNVTYNDIDNTGIALNIGDKINNGLENLVSNINSQMSTLFTLLSMENNFTINNITELKRSFINKKIIRNEYISDAKELLIWGKKEFEKYYYPPTIIELSIVDLFRCIDIGCQVDKNKLQLEEIVRVRYEKFNIDIKAKIIELSIDFENSDISVVISNISEINRDKDKFIKLLNQSINSAMTLEVNKENWSDITTANNNIANIMDILRGNIKNEINLASNETVTLNKSGLTAVDINDPNRFIRITHSCLGLTKTGGNTYETAITPDGVIAEKLIGKILAGINLTIDASDSQGNKTFEVNQNGVKISGLALEITNGGIPESQINPTSVANWNSASQEAQDYADAILNIFKTTTYNTDITNLQSQIDGNITTWFYDYEPTLINIPTSNWTTDEDKNNHLGDLFYNITTGYAYRFAFNITYQWIKITDTDVTKALADASKAQDTADNKRRVFMSQPIPPYDIGDLWRIEGETDLKICTTPKIIDQLYFVTDWVYATDVQTWVNTQISEIDTSIATLQSNIDQFSSDLVLSLSEANTLKLSLDNVTAESTDIINIATSLGITTEKNNYSIALTTLIDYLNTNWLGKTYPLTITLTQRTNVTTYFQNVESNKSVLINKITAVREQNANLYSDANLNDFIDNIYVADQLNIQSQIDGKIESYFTTTDPNIWLEVDRVKHDGDMWYNTSTKLLKRYNSSTNIWELIEDQKAIDAYNNASVAQDTADGKRRVFVAQPVPPYDIGDLWTQGISGDLMRCTVAKLSGTYTITDWILATKYTDDTIANQAQQDAINAQNTANIANALLADLANDNKLTASEKQLTKQEWDIIMSEKSIIESQANYYGIVTELTNYNNSYSTLNTYITPLLTDLTTTSDIEGTTFRNNFKVYYDNRTTLLTAISNKAKLLADNAQATANNSVQQGTLYNGVKLDSVDGLAVTRSDNKSRSILNATDGLKIQIGDGTGNTWTDKLYADTNGNLNLLGNLIVGAGNIIVKADNNGLYAGNSVFASAPFRVDMNGNLSANSVDIKGNIDCDLLKISGVSILDELNQKINGTYLADNSIGASKIKTNELIVGTNITMGANASITWGQITSQPFIPVTASDVGAVAVNSYVTTLPNFIQSTKITQTRIESPEIVGGSIASNTTIDVGTDAKIGRNLFLTAEELSTIFWKDILNVEYGRIEMESPAKRLSIYGTNATQIGITGKNTYINGNVTFENPIVAKFG